MTQPHATLTGHAARNAAEDRLPSAQITFYNRLILLRRWLASGEMVEHPVSPEGLSAALGEEISFQSGLLLPDTLHVAQSGDTKSIIAYMPPAIEGLWLDGEADALRVPLPGFLMRRKWNGHTSPEYSIWAVQQRPTTLQAQLYRAPLPNIFPDGSCWGTVKHPPPEAMRSTNALDADWQAFIGSRFGNHDRHGKSQRFEDDIIAMWRHLDETQADSYPLDDLVEYQTLEEVLS